MVDSEKAPLPTSSQAELNEIMTTKTMSATNGAAHTTPESKSAEDSATTAPASAEMPAISNPISAPPKVNPWKVLAEKKSHKAPQEAAKVTVAPASTVSGEPDVAAANGMSPVQTRKTHRPSRSTVPVIDDATLWPTLDKALEEHVDATQRNKGNGETTDGTAAPSAPKVTGKEKWTKYTPTITYAPIPSKAARGGANGSKSATRGSTSARTGGREKLNPTENGTEAKSKSSRSSDTSRSRGPKIRSSSVSVTRAERPNREDVEADATGPGPRSHSSKRSEAAGSMSAPIVGTPMSDASKSPQVGALTGQSADQLPLGANGEQRTHRASYDSAFAPRGRGGYRGTRGNFQANFGSRYQQHAYMQPQFQNARAYGPRDQMAYAGFEQYPNFVNPALAAPMMIDPLVARQMVLNQCEYYFSIENLCKDLFLRKHMDAEGFVNLPILANFNRLRSLTLDYALIRDVCHVSNHIELRASPGAYDKIRRAEGWEQWVLPEDQRDPSTRDLPEQVASIPLTKTQDENVGEESRNMSDSIGAPSFVPGQTTSTMDAPSTALNENFASLGMGRKLSPEVEEFKSSIKAAAPTE